MNTSDLKAKLKNSLEYYKEELHKVRTGRVNPSLLEDLKINAYGSVMSLRELGSIAVIDAQTLSVSTWDKEMLSVVVKAILGSDLKLNPVEKGDVVLVPVPPLTQDRRLELTKIVSAKLEECRQSFRNIRQDFMKKIELDFANKEFGEDEKFKLKEQVEDVVKEFQKEAEDLAEGKKKDLMSL